MPTYRLKYLPKNDVFAKLSELEISWIERWVDFNCDLASMMTMCEMISAHVFPVTFLTVVHRWIYEILSYSANNAKYRV